VPGEDYTEEKMNLKDIEVRFNERLRYCSGLRRSILLYLQAKIPFIVILEHNLVFHGVLFACAFFLICGLFAVIRRLSLFSFHPLFMILGVVIFLAEGIVSFRNPSLLETFSPIMQYNKKIKVSINLLVDLLSLLCFLLCFPSTFRLEQSIKRFKQWVELSFFLVF
jgi:hypothetical protein